MVFSDTTTRQGLLQEVEDLTGVGATGISGNPILLQTFTRNINNWYLRAVGWLLESSHKWQFDDSNYTDLPRATADLVADQRDYTLPAATAGGNASTFLRLLKLSVLDSSGLEVVLEHSDVDEARLNEMYSTSGIPRFYKLVGNSIKVYPAASATSTTLTAGLIAYFERSVDLFTTSDTTQQPGIPQLFHRILSLGAALDQGIPNDRDEARAERNLQKLEVELKRFQVDKNRDVRVRMTPRRERYF